MILPHARPEAWYRNASLNFASGTVRSTKMLNKPASSRSTILPWRPASVLDANRARPSYLVLSWHQRNGHPAHRWFRDCIALLAPAEDPI